MKIILGFSCLVVLAVTAVVTGAPEQELAIEDQIADFDEDHFERRDLDCKQQPACTDAGGKCISKKDECIGDRFKGKKLCKNRKCICCVPVDPSLIVDGHCTTTELLKAVPKCVAKAGWTCVTGTTLECWNKIVNCIVEKCFPPTL